LQIGDIGRGDEIKIIYKDPKRIPVLSFVQAMMSSNMPELMHPLLMHEELPLDRKSLLKKRVLDRYDGEV
jgi:hypothetical protein